MVNTADCKVPKEELETMTVLMVDDEANVLRSLKRILRPEPYKIVTAESGEEALEYIRKNYVNMIISDQRMPGISGIQLLESAREISPDTIRIILTGYSDLKAAEDAINRVQIYRFLSKPWNDEDLKNTIKEGLNKWWLEQEHKKMFRTIQEQNQSLKNWNTMLEQKVEERTRALREAHEQLIQSEKMASLGVMAGGVGHEINNPLGGILGITQLLLSDPVEDKQLKEDLETIQNAALHCSEIVKNLLSFSRGSDRKQRDMSSLPKMVEEVLTLIGHTFRNKNVQLDKDIPTAFPYLVVNQHQIKQVLINLLVNAEQASGNGSKVHLRARRNEDRTISIEVADHGKGIPQEIKEKIFDPFFTTKPEGEGTGLGLSVSYRIVQEHGGKITVDSNEEGTSVCLVLPPETAADHRPEEEAQTGKKEDERRQEPESESLVAEGGNK
ncbi:MAG: response regulator [bacterium]